MQRNRRKGVNDRPKPGRANQHTLALLFKCNISALLLSKRNPFLVTRIGLVSLGLPDGTTNGQRTHHIDTVIRVVWPLVIVYAVDLEAPFLKTTRPPFSRNE